MPPMSELVSLPRTGALGAFELGFRESMSEAEVWLVDCFEVEPFFSAEAFAGRLLPFLGFMEPFRADESGEDCRAEAFADWLEPVTGFLDSLFVDDEAVLLSTEVENLPEASDPFRGNGVG